MKWAALVSPAQRPAILNEKHKDFWWILKEIPRSWTSWLGDPPERMLLGDTTFPLKPIPNPGDWYLILPLYFAMTTKGGWHFRIGFRWDDVDGYYALSFTIKRYKNN